MKELATILIVVLTLVLGRYLITSDGLSYRILMNLYSGIFIFTFGYGVFNILKRFEKNGNKN